MNAMKVIPVCTVTDENMAFAVATMFVSLLENRKEDTFYKLYCFVTSSTSGDDRQRICNITKRYPNCTVEILDMGTRYLDSVNRSHRITNACLYKFAIIDTLVQYDKVIYLDADLFVKEDLQELYATDIENYYIAGVFNILYYLKKREQLCHELNIPDLVNYINAGVMLMNLKKLREDRILPKLEEYIGCFQNSVDQHIFNKVCYGHIKCIPPKYNFTLWYKDLYEGENAHIFYTEKELNEVLQSPAIIHYTGERKPWLYEDVYLAWQWYSYYKKTPYRHIRLTRQPLITKKSQKTFTIRNYIFKKYMVVLQNLYTKFGIATKDYLFLTTIKRLKQINQLPYVIILTDIDKMDIDISNLIDDLCNRHKNVFVIYSKGRKNVRQLNDKGVFTFKFPKLKPRQFKGLLKCKNIIISEIDTYEYAQKLQEYHISYFWHIKDTQKQEQLVNESLIIKNIYNNSKNIINGPIQLYD